MTSLSIVSTLYDSQATVKQFVERICHVVKKITHNFEIILVDDGSCDKVLEVCQELLLKFPQIKLIQLSRNFGHHKAMMVGLEHATKDYIFLIDSDLEESPEELLIFFQTLVSTEADSVYGIQKTRQGSIINRFCGWLYYILFNFMTGMKIPKNVLTVRLMTRNYVKALLQYPEKEIIIGGIWKLVGFKQVPKYVLKTNKKRTSYNFKKRFSYVIDTIISFSFKPLYFFCYLGFFIFGIAVCFSSYIFLRKIFLNDSISGWTSLIMSIWLLGGLVILFLSVISLYIAKIFSEVKNRPRALIKKIYENKQVNTSSTLDKLLEESTKREDIALKK